MVTVNPVLHPTQLLLIFRWILCIIYTAYNSTLVKDSPNPEMAPMAIQSYKLLTKMREGKEVRMLTS
jgi:hypothetical protein